MDKSFLVSNDDIKAFIIEALKNKDATNLEVYEILDTVNNPKNIIEYVGFKEVTKEATLGQELIPVIGKVEAINNSFWEMQDPAFKRLFPELSDSDIFEFLIIIIDNVKFNPETNKVEITQKRYKFSTKN